MADAANDIIEAPGLRVSRLGKTFHGATRPVFSNIDFTLGRSGRLAIEFDCYLIDELVAVGDARFQQKCQEELFTHRKDRAFMMASHDVHMVAHYCDRAIIIESGKCKIFEDVQEAVDIYSWLRAA